MPQSLGPCKRYLGICLVLLFAVPSGCGGESRRVRPRPRQAPSFELHHDGMILHVQTSIDAADSVRISIRMEPAQEARLEAAIASARTKMGRLSAACERLASRHPGVGAAACVDTPGEPAEAARELSRALDEMVEALTAARIMPPEDPDKGPHCSPVPVCPHRGGDGHHDECADREPPNMYPGCDVRVYDKHFDALAASRVLWEVKTGAWSSYSPFLREMTRRAFIVEARAEDKIAGSCGYEFVFAVADAELHGELSEELAQIEVRHIPRCMRGGTIHVPQR